MSQIVRHRAARRVMAALALLLAVLIAPSSTTAYAVTPAGPQGLVQVRETSFTTQSTGTEVQIGYLNLSITIPANEARCVRVESTVRAQAGAAATTGDMYIKRNSTTRFGSSIYLGAAGGAGATTLNTAGIDLLTAGTYTYTFWIKRTVGISYFMVGATTGSQQQSWIEDLGAAVLDEFGGGNCPQ